jgi:hypothetical protein
LDEELEELINNDLQRLSQAAWDLSLPSRLKVVVELVEPNLTVSLDEVVLGVEEVAGANPATAARVTIASALRNAGLSAPAPSTQNVIQLAAERSRTSDEIIKDWLGLNPPPSDVMSVLAARGQAARLEQPVKKWSLRQGDSLDADFLLEAFDNSSLRQEWFQFFEVSSPTRKGALKGLSGRLAQAPNPDQRRRVVEAINAVPLDTPGDGRLSHKWRSTS